MSIRANEWQQGPTVSGETNVPATGGLLDRGLRLAGGWLGAAWERLSASIEVRRIAQRRRSLRVVETVAMGEKRFVAIIQVEEQRFLVGGGSAGVALLARLDQPQAFATVLDERASSAASVREAW